MTKRTGIITQLRADVRDLEAEVDRWKELTVKAKHWQDEKLAALKSAEHQRGYAAGLAAGVKQERESVVAWLRIRTATAKETAVEIEGGAHTKETTNDV